MQVIWVIQGIAFFRKAQLWYRAKARGGWRQPTFLNTPPRGIRGVWVEEMGAFSNSTFIKTYWRKTTYWSVAAGGENQRDGQIKQPSHYPESWASKLPWTVLVFLCFFLLPFFPSFHLLLLLLKQLSSHHYQAHSFNLSSFICSIPPILSPPLYRSPVPPFPLSWPCYLGLSTSCGPPTTARSKYSAVWKPWDAPPLRPILSHVCWVSCCFG